jgi:hypothetical protein
MTSSLPKWNDTRTDALTTYVGDETPVSQETVAGAAESLETTTRSIASKLRKLGYAVELASSRATRSYSDEEEATLRAFVEDNPGKFTYAQIAEAFEGGKFSPKSVQGKILSMELTDCIKPTPKVVLPRTYTPEEEKVFVKMAKAGAFVEAIAEKLNKNATSVRGKALSLLKSGDIEKMPVQEFTKGTTRVDPLGELGDVSELTVEEIAKAVNKTPRGVKTMLTRRGIVAADYDGAARHEKLAAAHCG